MADKPRHKKWLAVGEIACVKTILSNKTTYLLT